MANECLLDQEIKETNVFPKIVCSIVKSMLYTNSNVKRIYIDVNSCVSAIFRLDNGERYQTEMVETITEYFKTFIEESLNQKKELIFLYTKEKSSAHVKICPTWCMERNERVKLHTCRYITEILFAIQLFSKDEPRIKLINVANVHPALVVEKNEIRATKRFLVLSKDNVFKCMTNPKMDLFDGKLYETNQFRVERTVQGGYQIPEADVLMPYYFAIRGATREGFDGIKGYGPNRTLKYLEENRLNIKSGTDHPLKEHCDIFVKLFDINKLMLENKEPIPIVS